MKTNFVRQTVLPVLAAFIWGTAFVAQSLGAELLPPFAFNAARSAVAFVFLLAVCLVLRAVRRGRGRPASSTVSRGQLALGGLCCGFLSIFGIILSHSNIEFRPPQNQWLRVIM